MKIQGGGRGHVEFCWKQ